jgi:hypothetical protein
MLTYDTHRHFMMKRFDRALILLEDGLIWFKRFCEAYRSSAIEVHSACAVVLIGVHIANPYFEVFVTTPVFRPLQAAIDSEPFWGGVIIAFGLARLLAIYQQRIAWRRVLAIVSASLWSGLFTLYMFYAPYYLGGVLAPTFIVTDAISYIRTSKLTRMLDGKTLF